MSVTGRELSYSGKAQAAALGVHCLKGSASWDLPLGLLPSHLQGVHTNSCVFDNAVASTPSLSSTLVSFFTSTVEVQLLVNAGVPARPWNLGHRAGAASWTRVTPMSLIIKRSQWQSAC